MGFISSSSYHMSCRARILFIILRSYLWSSVFILFKQPIRVKLCTLPNGKHDHVHTHPHSASVLWVYNHNSFASLQVVILQTFLSSLWISVTSPKVKWSLIESPRENKKQQKLMKWICLLQFSCANRKCMNEEPGLALNRDNWRLICESRNQSADARQTSTGSTNDCLLY